MERDLILPIALGWIVFGAVAGFWYVNRNKKKITSFDNSILVIPASVLLAFILIISISRKVEEQNRQRLLAKYEIRFLKNYNYDSRYNFNNDSLNLFKQSEIDSLNLLFTDVSRSQRLKNIFYYSDGSVGFTKAANDNDVYDVDLKNESVAVKFPGNLNDSLLQIFREADRLNEYSRQVKRSISYLKYPSSFCIGSVDDYKFYFTSRVPGDIEIRKNNKRVAIISGTVGRFEDYLTTYRDSYYEKLENTRIKVNEKITILESSLKKNKKLKSENFNALKNNLPTCSILN